MPEQFPDQTLAETLRITGAPVILTVNEHGVPCYVGLDETGELVLVSPENDRGDPEPEPDHES